MSTPQIKTGKSITMIQLIISVVVVLASAVGLYVKNQVTMAEMNQRMLVIEHSQTQWQANAVALRQARDSQQKEINDKIAKNNQDIELLKATKKDK